MNLNSAYNELKSRYYDLLKKVKKLESDEEYNRLNEKTKKLSDQVIYINYRIKNYES